MLGCVGLRSGMWEYLCRAVCGTGSYLMFGVTLLFAVLRERMLEYLRHAAGGTQIAAAATRPQRRALATHIVAGTYPPT
eukprot:518083-Rhodomonas_salina.2